MGPVHLRSRTDRNYQRSKPCRQASPLQHHGSTGRKHLATHSGRSLPGRGIRRQQAGTRPSTVIDRIWTSLTRSPGRVGDGIPSRTESTRGNRPARSLSSGEQPCARCGRPPAGARPRRGNRRDPARVTSTGSRLPELGNRLQSCYQLGRFPHRTRRRSGTSEHMARSD